MDSKLLIAALAVGIASSGMQIVAAPPESSLNVQPLPFALAMKAAQTALTTCVSQGYSPTVTVTDRAGVMRIFLMADGAGPVAVIAGQRKAYTSAALGIRTPEFARMVAEQHLNTQALDPQLVTFGGGEPIYRHGVVIGAIAVGGSDQDPSKGNSDAPNEDCAKAGLDSIKSELN